MRHGKLDQVTIFPVHQHWLPPPRPRRNSLGGPFTRRAEVSRFLFLNSFLTPYPYTARIHPGDTVFLPTPLTVFYIDGPHTLLDNQPVQVPSFLGMGRTRPTPLPY